MYLYGQGDVLLKQVSQLPSKAVPAANTRRIVLAHGEATGHVHAVDVSDAQEFRLGMARRFIKVVRGAIVTHEEHAAIPLPPGIYEVVQQREYSPEAIRNVED
ncbi:MAG: hypothetical protein EPN36_10160 [Rhodanobacteraceae bacterium]|nr:MAG: hypothetical protein EPN36_10160 [Rhodanobacteraceae bacterium]